MERLRPYLALLLIALGVLFVQSTYGLCPQDDAFISFRYAANMADGHGLVFNPGERVEGYTNFLWTLLFVPIIASGLDPVPISTSLGMVATLLFLWSAWELADRRWLVPLLVACFPGMSLEAVQGLETVAFAFLVCQALRGGPRWFVWAGLAALTRPEGYAVFCLLWVWRRDWKSAATFCAITVPHLVFRVVYYGDIVPNTFHAKVGGTDTLRESTWSRGLEYIGRQVVDLRYESVQPHLVVLVLMLGFGVFSLVKGTISFDPRERSKLRDAVCVVGFYLAYIVLVGGDFKGTGRFLIPILAPLAFLAVTGTGNLSKASRGGLFRVMITGACIACALPGFEQMRAYAEHFARTWERQTAIAELLEAQGFPETEFQLAIHGAGIIPYYSGLRTLDLWGLNDAHIAQAESDDFGEGRAGHERSDYDYALSRRPLVILPEPLVALPYPAWASYPTGWIPPIAPEQDGRTVLPSSPEIFGEDFEREYVPFVRYCEDCGEGYEWVHFWVRGDAVEFSGFNGVRCEQPCPWMGDLLFPKFVLSTGAQ